MYTYIYSKSIKIYPEKKHMNFRRKLNVFCNVFFYRQQIENSKKMLIFVRCTDVIYVILFFIF